MQTLSVMFLRSVSSSTTRSFLFISRDRSRVMVESLAVVPYTLDMIPFWWATETCKRIGIVNYMKDMKWATIS